MSELKNKELCPVCGMDVRTDDIRADHKGRTFYFCSESDGKKFLADPEKYIVKVKAA